MQRSSVMYLDMSDTEWLETGDHQSYAENRSFHAQACEFLLYLGDLQRSYATADVLFDETTKPHTSSYRVERK